MSKFEVRLVTEPKVTLIAQTKFDAMHFPYDFPAQQGMLGGEEFVDAAVLAEAAGRVCYMSYEKGREHNAYLQNILESGHGSTLEHSSFSFLLEGISRSLTHELVRHRQGCSYSQLSQRYVDGSHIEFVVPPKLLALYRSQGLNQTN